MDCRDFRRRYSAYRDHHEPELAAEMDDHIEICPACAAFDRAVREGIEVLRGETIGPSAGFLSALEARIANAGPVPEPLPPRVSPWAATAASILVFALLALGLKDLSVLPEPVAAEAAPMVVAEPRVVPGMPFVIYERIKR